MHTKKKYPNIFLVYKYRQVAIKNKKFKFNQNRTKRMKSKHTTFNNIQNLST